MSRKTWLLALAAAAVGSAARAGGPPVVYAKVDKVVTEPAGGPAERVQIWGTFALMKSAEETRYTEPAAGYLYYTLHTGKEAECREEWEALKRAADKGQVVVFGHCHSPKEAGRFRKAMEKPGEPDVFPLGGVVALRPGEVDDPTAKALLAAVSAQLAKSRK